MQSIYLTREQRLMIDANTRWLKSGNATTKSFDSGQLLLGPQIVAMKRQGELDLANRGYEASFREGGRASQIDSTAVWGWAKLFMLAKNWNDLETIVHYHYDIMVTWNRLMKEEGNRSYFAGFSCMDMTPHFDYDEYDSGEYLRDQVHDSLDSAEDTTRVFANYGGSEYWERNYRISWSEYQDFLRLFPE